VKHQHLLTITALTIGLLAACGTTPQLKPIQGSPPSTLFQTTPNSGRLGALAAGAWETTRLTTGFDDLTSSAWVKSAGLSVTANALANTVDALDSQLDKLTGTSTTAMYANTKININAGETIDVSVVVAGSGTIHVWTQNTNDYSPIAGKDVTLTLSSTPQRVVIAGVQKPTGVNNNIQLVIGDINSTETVYVGGVRTRATDTGTTGGTTTPITVAPLPSWDKGPGVSMVDNLDTFQKITTTNASFVNTAVAVTVGETYRYTATLKGTGSILLVWQQRGGAYTKYVQKTVVLTGTAQTVSFDSVIPSNGAPAQIGISDINTTETVFVKDIKIEQIGNTLYVRPTSIPQNDKTFYDPLAHAGDNLAHPLSIIVAASGLDTTGLQGWSQLDASDPAVLVDRPGWGKAVQLTVAAGAPDNINVDWHKRGHRKGISKDAFTVQSGKPYYFDFNMEIPSSIPGTQQIIKPYPRQTPSQTQRNFAGIEFISGAGNGFAFGTEIHADGIYLNVQQPLGNPVGTSATGLTLYADSSSKDLKLTASIPYDQKLHFRIFYLPHTTDGIIVASIDGFGGGSVNTPILLSGPTVLNNDFSTIGTDLTAGQSSTIFVDDVKINEALSLPTDDGVGIRFASKWCSRCDQFNDVGHMAYIAI
jgi:hypothetical protein